MSVGTYYIVAKSEQENAGGLTVAIPFVLHSTDLLTFLKQLMLYLYY